MAITIEQQPYLYNVKGQKLIYVVTSDNVSEDGFKFKFDIQSDGNSIATFFVTPNAQGAGLIDIAQLFHDFKNDEFLGLIHGYETITNVFTDDGASRNQVDVTVYEYWMVGGVLTENTGSTATADQIIVTNGFIPKKYGYKPNPEGSNTDTSFTFNSGTKRMYSDRKYDTYTFSQASSYGITAGTNTIFIPCFESDFGVLYASLSYVFLTNNGVDKIRVTLYDSLLTSHTYTETIGGGNEALVMFPVYPANLNASSISGIVKPQDYVGWKYYTVRLLNASNGFVSASYVFINMAELGGEDCRHDKIRLAWTNSRGGWDYFNFTKKNESQITIQRKRYYEISGNYADVGTGAPFADPAHDGGLTERTPIVEDYLNITSDWIQEGEFEFLKSLLISNQVHWVQTDGTHIPVVIENNDYTAKRERNGKLKNLELKLRMAHNLL